jgi:hypothetical protein
MCIEKLSEGNVAEDWISIEQILDYKGKFICHIDSTLRDSQINDEVCTAGTRNREQTLKRLLAN